MTKNDFIKKVITVYVDKNLNTGSFSISTQSGIHSFTVNRVKFLHAEDGRIYSAHPFITCNSNKLSPMEQLDTVINFRVDLCEIIKTAGAMFDLGYYNDTVDDIQDCINTLQSIWDSILVEKIQINNDIVQYKANEDMVRDALRTIKRKYKKKKYVNVIKARHYQLADLKLRGDQEFMETLKTAGLEWKDIVTPDM